jgi:DNA polymerase elongation subunit (family B)
MSKRFVYSNVFVLGDNICFRGKKYSDGKTNDIYQKIKYKPSLFIPSNRVGESKYKTLYGEYCERKKFNSMKDCRDFIKKYRNISNFDFYGNTNFIYPFISDVFPNHIDWNISDFNIAYLDIETECSGGFPDIKTANEVINLITFTLNDTYYTLGCHDYDNKDGLTNYIKCIDEQDLLLKFVKLWTNEYPDIVTGWNVEGFDITYIVNRITRLLGENVAKKLSPYNKIRYNERILRGQEVCTYQLFGVSILDYLDLYRRYTYQNQESYKLDNIASIELNEKKLDYSEYGSLHTLYQTDWQKFVDYNIQDVKLVHRLDNKMKLIELVIQIAYYAKVNFEDVASQVRTWDSIIFNKLKSDNIVIPQKHSEDKERAYEGAYVKDPICGEHHWVASFDLNSLYPHLIMQYNISPETIIELSELPNNISSEISTLTVNKLLDGNISDDLKTSMQDINFTITPNGTAFSRNEYGVLPKLMDELYAQRKINKKKMIECKQKFEKCTDEIEKYQLQNEISKYNNLQMSQKILLNSCYGGCGNQYFRYYDLRIASGITTSGQLSIRWIENKLNEYFSKLLDINKDFVIASDTDSIVSDSIIYVNSEKITIEDYFNSLPCDFIKFDDFNDDYVKRVNSGDYTKSFDGDKIIDDNINYVMKHKVEKELFKIEVDDKNVIVTEDHSLIVERAGNIISVSPKELIYGDSIIYI